MFFFTNIFPKHERGWGHIVTWISPCLTFYILTTSLESIIINRCKDLMSKLPMDVWHNLYNVYIYCHILSLIEYPNKAAYQYVPLRLLCSYYCMEC